MTNSAIVKRCPRSNCATMILDEDRYSASSRLYCPVCGETEWLNFQMHSPSQIEAMRMAGIPKERKEVKPVRKKEKR